MTSFVKLTKAETKETLFINMNNVIIISIKGKETQVCFVDGCSWIMVVETTEEIYKLIHG